MKRSPSLMTCVIICALISSTAPVSRSTDKGNIANPTGHPNLVQDLPSARAELIQSPRQDPELSRRLRKYDLLQMDPGSVVNQVRTSGRLFLRTSQQNYDLQMTLNDMRAPNYVATVIGADGVMRKLPQTEVNTFKGTARGDDRTRARLSITERGVEGSITSGQTRYFLQPARDLSLNAKDNEFVFYEASALTEEGATCGLSLAEEVAAREELAAVTTKTQLTSELKSAISPFSPMRLVQLATDADAEYVAALGNATQANNQIMTIMNMVEDIYEFDMGITFDIVHQNTWTDAMTDPYASTAPSTLLGEFRNHWNANFTAVPRDLAHLWTGKDLDGTTIGIASLSVVCRDPSRSYGLSQRFPVDASNPITAQTVVLTAHEIGHNFAALHTNQTSTEIPPDFDRPCDNSIMEASVGNGSAFCLLSRSEIIGHASSFSSCLSDAGPPPPLPPCTEVSLDGTGLTANGSLSNSDCRSVYRGVEYFADQYSFNGIAGQRVSITFVHTSGTLDPFLYLIGPDGNSISQDDDSNGNTDSRIPGSGTIALPATGKYILEATSFLRQQMGNYTITVTRSDCTLTVSPTSQHFSAAGGSGMIQVHGSGLCGSGYQFTQRPNSATWLVPQMTGGANSTALPFTVAANSNSAGRRAFLIVGPSQADFSGGISIPITQSGTTPDCTTTPIAIGQTINGNLAAGDCESSIKGNGFMADRYTFNAAAGQEVSMTLTSSIFDTFLNLIAPDGTVLLNDDDSGGSTNSRIPGGPGMLRLDVGGTYTIEAASFGSASSGGYSLTLSGTAPAPPTIQFFQSAFTVFETQSSMVIIVTRSGDTSGTSSIDYATNDTSGSNNCPVVSGAASSRCDYIRTLGKLVFAPGETTKIILVPIVDDIHTEGTETFSMALSNVSGASLGAPSTAMLSITENEAGATNPIDNAGFFARQHYIDFLNREPDSGGLGFWTNEIISCGGDQQCIEVKRINVSAAFFLSIEFQETGYLVYRMYKSGFGNLPGLPVPVTLNNFLRDTQEIGKGVQVGIGNWQAQLEANKQAFALAFVQRPEFQTAFPNSMTAAQFVDKLNTNAGLVLSASERATLEGILGGTPADVSKRAQVVRQISEDETLKNAEFNKAFVLMQYFGYLRRNPNDAPDSNFAGWQFWLDKLNQFNGNFINAEMVKAFITSIEYRQRFGP